MRLEVKRIWFDVKDLRFAVTQMRLWGDTNAVTGETKAVHPGSGLHWYQGCITRFRLD